MNGFVGKNIVWLLISQTATWVVSLLVLVLTPDLFGRADFGAWSFAVIYVQFFALIAGFETGPLLIRLVAQDHGIVGRYVYNALLFKVVSVIALSAIAIGLAVVLGLDGQTVTLIAIGCAGMMFSNLNFVLQSALGGMHRMARPAMWMVLQLYVGSLGGILVVLAGGGVVAFGTVVALSALIPLVPNYRRLRGEIHRERTLDWQVWRVLLLGGLPMLALTTLNTFYGTIDFGILWWLAGDDTVGLYGVAYRWAAIPLFICTAVVAASFPRFAEYGRELGTRFARAVNDALWLTVIVSVPCAFTLATVADDLVTTFHDPDYLGSINALRILALQIPIAAVDTVLATALVASDRFHRYTFVALAACVLTPIALYITINAALDGNRNPATAAAWVTTGTEIFVFMGALLMRSPGVFDRHTARRCVAAALAAAAIPLVMWPLDGLPLVVKGVVALATYIVGAVVLRAITVGEIREAVGRVRQVLLRRGGYQPELVPDDAP